MDWFLAALGFLFIAFSLGAAFTLGVAMVCKATKWAPINLSITINRVNGE